MTMAFQKCYAACFLIGSLTLTLIHASTLAADDGGQHKDLLTSALNAAMQGDCSEELMTPLLRGTCEDQQPAMGQKIESLGPIESIKFLGTQQSQMGPAEVYRVRHKHGSMIWMINTDSDGKILVLWSPG